MNMKGIRHLVLLQPYIDWTSHDWCIVHHKMMTALLAFVTLVHLMHILCCRMLCGTCSTILHMDGTSTVCGQWYGRSVKAVVVTMACYGVPEGGSRSGAAPLPLEVALLTKADEACLTDMVNSKFLYVELPSGTSFLLISSSFLSVLSALHFMHGYYKNPLPYLLVLSHLWICLPFLLLS